MTNEWVLFQFNSNKIVKKMWFKILESIEKESKIDGQEKIENVKRFSSKTG